MGRKCRKRPEALPDPKVIRATAGKYGILFNCIKDIKHIVDRNPCPRV